METELCEIGGGGTRNNADTFCMRFSAKSILKTKQTFDCHFTDHMAKIQIFSWISVKKINIRIPPTFIVYSSNKKTTSQA